MSIYRQEPRYTKRPTAGARIGKLLFVLLLLFGLGAAIFLLFLRGYVVETAEGPRLQLPFLSSLHGKTTLPASEDADEVFQRELGVTVPTDTLLSPLHAVRVSEEELLDGNAEDVLRRAGGNAVLLDMRDETGKLHYVSNLDRAIEAGASSAMPGLNEAIRSLNRKSDLYSIARVSCLSDDYLTTLQPKLALQRAGGVPWRDDAQHCYLAPEQESVQEYLSDICRELAALGFDEILLDACAYPTTDTAVSTFAGSDAVETLSLHLEDFYQAMRRTLVDEGVHLSIRYLPSEADEENRPRNGQSLEALLPLADRVFLEEDGKSASEVFASHGLSSANCPTVLILSKPGLNSTSWAIF